MSFGATIGPIVFIYSADILPLKGFALCFLANYAGTFFVGLIYPLLASTSKNN